MTDPDAKPAICLGEDCPHREEWVAFVLNYHHNGESHCCCLNCIRKRVNGILDGEKPEEEWGPRMEAMGVIPLSATFEGVLKTWMAELNAADAKWKAKLDAVDAKWKAEKDAVYAKWQPEWDAINAKWKAELDAINAKWEAEWDTVNAKYAALLPTPIPVEPWLCEEL